VKHANPLDSKFGRMLTFFLLYLSEGLPYGFITTAMVFQLRGQGFGPERIGTFTAVVMLPWAWKWAMGPVVDVFYSDKWGRRRMWIVAAQAMMLVTLLSGMNIEFTSNMNMHLLVILLVVHNIFAATQDVAIDALACNTLKEDERGLANGLMFGGAHVGAVIGGAGTLKLAHWLEIFKADLEKEGTPSSLRLAEYINFNLTFLFIGFCMLMVTIFVSMRLKERPEKEPRPKIEGNRLAHACGEIRDYFIAAVRAMFLNRPAFVGLLIAMLPIGALALSRNPRLNMAMEFGFSKSQIADLEIVMGIIWIASCMVGGLLSDIFGRRKMMAIYVAFTALPTIYLVAMMQSHGWIMPIDTTDPARPEAPEELINAFWGALAIYNIMSGLVYGTTTALFMDITNPAVAATQFTAYMAVMNLTFSYTDIWQGYAAKHFGYPIMLSIDTALGMLCILLLPLTVKAVGSHGDDP
jgi:PAT family beta-lactamase induction signal transducer AmpG